VIAVLFAFNGPARAQIVGILIGATLVAGVGILDDRGLLHHQIKLFVGMPLAAAILLASGIRAQVFSVLVAGAAGFSGRRSHGGLGGGGLRPRSASSITWTAVRRRRAMASVFFAMLAYLNGQTLVTTLAAAVLGAAAGFSAGTSSPRRFSWAMAAPCFSVT